MPGMTLTTATQILSGAEAIDGQMLNLPPDEPGLGGWVFWTPGPCEDVACLGGYWYTADQLEAIAVWMRHYMISGKEDTCDVSYC